MNAPATTGSTSIFGLRLRKPSFIGVVMCVSVVSAMAAATSPADIEARFANERAKCVAGESHQDQATCLREAGAARDAAKKGQLDNGDTRYRHNAKVRCDALTGDEARDCVARMNGKGTVSGSVAGGGVLRETVTREVKPVAPAASGASAAAGG